jgi:hypothetical protein
MYTSYTPRTLYAGMYTSDIRGFVYELYDTKVIVGFLTSVCIYVYELYVTNVIRGGVYDRFFLFQKIINIKF